MDIVRCRCSVRLYFVLRWWHHRPPGVAAADWVSTSSFLSLAHPFSSVTQWNRPRRVWSASGRVIQYFWWFQLHASRVTSLTCMGHYIWIPFGRKSVFNLMQVFALLPRLTQ